jgi:hypothetical protein
VIGEVALYGGGTKLAEVTAETERKLLRVDRRFILRSDAGSAELVADFHRLLAETFAHRPQRYMKYVARSEAIGFGLDAIVRRACHEGPARAVRTYSWRRDQRLARP